MQVIHHYSNKLTKDFLWKIYFISKKKIEQIAHLEIEAQFTASLDERHLVIINVLQVDHQLEGGGVKLEILWKKQYLKSTLLATIHDNSKTNTAQSSRFFSTHPIGGETKEISMKQTKPRPAL